MLEYRVAELLWDEENPQHNTLNQLNKILSEGYHVEALFECKDNTVIKGRIMIILHKGCEDHEMGEGDGWKKGIIEDE